MRNIEDSLSLEMAAEQKNVCERRTFWSKMQRFVAISKKVGFINGMEDE